MSSSQLPPGCRILEGIVTTVSDVAGFSSMDRSHDPCLLEKINIAPMGPVVDEKMTSLILRPFTTSTTYRNLKKTGSGVFHITDDALLIARGAVGKIQACWAGGDPRESIIAVEHAHHIAGVVLADACRYHEFEVVSLDDSQERTRIEARIIDTVRVRDFFGFNRARHAILEAAILATRIHLTGAAFVLAELNRLQIIIDKTGSEIEHQAMNELREFVQQSKHAQ